MLSQLNDKLIENSIVATEAEITPSNMALLQWAHGNLLNNPDLGFDTVYAVSSMREIGMNWLTPPEITMSGCGENVFDIATATALFTPVNDDEDTKTMLSPENVF
jgi:hypothetical protein